MGMEVSKIKECSKCHQVRELSQFGKRKDSPDGLRANCNHCRNLTSQKWIQLNKEHYTQYHIEYRKQHPKRKENQEKKRIREKRWILNHPEERKRHLKKSNDKQLLTTKGRLMSNVAAAVRQSLVKDSKNRRHWEDLVGYTVTQLKKHLEKQFENWMTWDNYGKEWHIDHIIPVSVHNFETPEDVDFKNCWSLENLQPLGKVENIRKKNHLESPFQPSLLI